MRVFLNASNVVRAQHKAVHGLNFKSFLLFCFSTASVGYLLTKYLDISKSDFSNYDISNFESLPQCKRRCQNGGSCINGKNRCKCEPGYRGRFCQKRKDILLLYLIVHFLAFLFHFLSILIYF